MIFSSMCHLFFFYYLPILVCLRRRLHTARTDNRQQCDIVRERSASSGSVLASAGTNTRFEFFQLAIGNRIRILPRTLMQRDPHFFLHTTSVCCKASRNLSQRILSPQSVPFLRSSLSASLYSELYVCIRVVRGRFPDRFLNLCKS